MEFRVLGPLEVEHDGEVLELGGKRQRSVLAALVLHAREVIGTDRLADTIWDGEPPASATTTLRSYVSRLRKALEASGDGGSLRTTKAGYVLDVPDDLIDARRFERLVAEGRERRGDPSAAVSTWTTALGLWRGDAYQDFAYQDFAATESRRLTELRLTCLEDLYEARIDAGRHEDVVGDLEAFHSANPDRERALGALMLALYRSGRQGDALRVYEEGRVRLAEELGVDPSPELRELHERIVRQDDAVRASEPARTGKQTMTFLLGDVERSTAALRALGDRYADVLDQHRAVVREAFAAHGGRAVSTTGDGVFAAFDGATSAVRAATEAQLALCALDVAEDGRLPVRMGVHTGEVMFSGAEPVGEAIHLAARVMDAAHGGQILLSQATRELVEDAALEFVDTGLHVLRDFRDHVRLYQVRHPELRAEFPPLRTRAARTDNLPHRPTSFVGREDDVERIIELIEDSRVVTLSGVGGVGKTRLAVEVASRLTSRYEDGAWLCELAPILDPAAVVPSMASTLGVDLRSGVEPREALLTALAQRETLLVIDNCEHVLEPVAELIEEIVHRAGRTTVLATSRESVGVDGERTVRVRSLAEGAVGLFADRARAVRPDFELGPDNEGAVRDICSKLDGIPLAIELAAVRVTSMSPAEVAERLDHDLRFLRSGRRAVADRHRTLHAAIESSYDGLSAAERLLFDRLSVFAGGFDLNAAEAVCGRDLDVDVADGLASLEAKSMVDADVGGPQTWFTLLETMRQFGQDKLAERGEAEGTLRAHAEYMGDLLVLARAAFVASGDYDPGAARRWFDNARAAWAFAKSSGDVDLMARITTALYVGMESGFEEVGAWLEVVLDLIDGQDHEALPDVLTSLSLHRGRMGAYDQAEQLSRRAFDLLPDPNDVRRLMAYQSLFLALQSAGDLEGARALYEDAMALAQLHGADVMLALGEMLRSTVDCAVGNFDEAVRKAESGLARTSAPALRAMGLYFLGDALQQAGDDERAVEHLEGSLALCRQIDFRFFESINLMVLAQVKARRGDLRDALEMFSQVIDHWRRSAQWTRQWVTLLNLVDVFGRLGRDESVITMLAAADSSDTVAPPVGAHAERLDALRAEIGERMDASDLADAGRRGRAMSDDDLVVYAKAEIRAALEAV